MRGPGRSICVWYGLGRLRLRLAASARAAQNGFDELVPALPKLLVDRVFGGSGWGRMSSS